MAQTEPPFADTKQLAERWPPLRQPELHSPAFHEFLRKCSEPAASRPSATELLKVRHFFFTVPFSFVDKWPCSLLLSKMLVADQSLFSCLRNVWPSKSRFRIEMTLYDFFFAFVEFVFGSYQLLNHFYW